MPVVDGVRKRPVGSEKIFPVASWHSVYRMCVRCGGAEISEEAGCGRCVVALALNGGVLVERTLARSWSRCPLIMASESGRWRRTCAEVRPGKLERKPLSIAAHHVEMAGENMAAW